MVHENGTKQVGSMKIEVTEAGRAILSHMDAEATSFRLFVSGFG